MSHDTTEAIKNICHEKGEGAVDPSRVTFKKFQLGYNNQARLDRPESVNSEAMIQVREANSVSSTWRVSSEFSISQSSMVYHLHNLNKII